MSLRLVVRSPFRRSIVLYRKFGVWVRSILSTRRFLLIVKSSFIVGIPNLMNASDIWSHFRLFVSIRAQKLRTFCSLLSCVGPVVPYMVMQYESVDIINAFISGRCVFSGKDVFALFRAISMPDDFWASLLTCSSKFRCLSRVTPSNLMVFCSSMSVFKNRNVTAGNDFRRYFVPVVIICVFS